ncbi:response regulator receiver sensor signal transduction histidine kinase [Candidatus Moduliflexus flocculans]|uniref:histidine kinase n=1 Tax=Candidatus Moduliflexus flocculans TaxID=1499966 RepID=A0A081BLF5_9BACT|nr:response regulator receiver sensor signal transduction histidine kinase [Candidatus Moduliflexus flocculans]
MSKPAILCVDDEKMILVSLKEELKRNFGDSYTIETVESGEEALELINEFEEDEVELPIVIADQLMPGMKGDELLINVHHRLPKTLKILLTGQAGAEAVGNAVNYAKLYRYISKPWQETDLTLTVNEALRSYFQDKKLEEQNAELQKLNLELEKWNVTLEQQVRERTAELEAQKIELAELNASKDKFFSIISHDLRSPFNALLGFTQILSENLERYSLEDIRQKVEKIHTSAERLFALLENLLTWSRIQRGAIEYSPEVIDLWELAEDNIELFLPNAEHKQINLFHHIPKGMRVYADYSMINTVIRNLTSNALKFTSAGERVDLLARPYDEQWVEVAVADTGRGIPPEVLPKLLRIDAHHTTEGTGGEKGTGLGLILCRELVEKNGGTLWIESELGKGSTFRFTVPKA